MHTKEQKAVDEWTTRLTGLPTERITEARERIDSFGIKHLSDELTRRADIDAAAASCMVVSSIEILLDRGVPENKLISKLRADRGIWPSVAELIGTRKALDFFDPEAKVELDAGPVSGGANADLRLTLPEIGQGVSIEFKAIGLSEEEIGFFHRSSELLPMLYPEIGVSTHHIAINNEHQIPIPSRDERKAHAAAQRKRVKKLPAHIRNLDGAVITAHFTEQRYLERVRRRIEESLRQMAQLSPFPCQKFTTTPRQWHGKTSPGSRRSPRSCRSRTILSLHPSSMPTSVPAECARRCW